MDYARLTTEFGILDGEERGAGLGAAEEIEVEGYSVRLILLRKGRVEMHRCYLEED